MNPKKRRIEEPKTFPIFLTGFIFIVLALISLLVWSAIKPVSEADQEARKQEQIARQQRIENVRNVLAESGATLEVTDKSISIFLPSSAAMKTNEFQAREIAIMARDRIGDGIVVRVKSPAGQTIATSH